MAGAEELSDPTDTAYACVLAAMDNKAQVVRTRAVMLVAAIKCLSFVLSGSSALGEHSHFIAASYRQACALHRNRQPGNSTSASLSLLP